MTNFKGLAATLFAVMVMSENGANAQTTAAGTTVTMTCSDGTVTTTTCPSAPATKKRSLKLDLAKVAHCAPGDSACEASMGYMLGSDAVVDNAKQARRLRVLRAELDEIRNNGGTMVQQYRQLEATLQKNGALGTDPLVTQPMLDAALANDRKAFNEAVNKFGESILDAVHGLSVRVDTLDRTIFGATDAKGNKVVEGLGERFANLEKAPVCGTAAWRCWVPIVALAVGGAALGVSIAGANGAFDSPPTAIRR